MIELPELLWSERSMTQVRLPEAWAVEVHRMRGARRPALTTAQLRAALEAPIGTPPLSELARGRSKAVILFDDMTRPTRVAEIGPIVVEALIAGGIAEEAISFVCALGAHGALTRNDLYKKVGGEILERFRVYNHNCYENCVPVGTTSRGTPLQINREVMSADLKIGIGCVTAHPNTGFSGGGKIALPGVAHIDSIAHFHLRVRATGPGTIGFGQYDKNVMRREVEEAARMMGLDFKVDVLFNENAEATAVFAGDFAQSHRVAAATARKTYGLRRGRAQIDIAVVNALAKPNELLVGYMVGFHALAPRHRGTIVLIANAPEGQVVHYLLSRFGEGYGGQKYPSARVREGIDLIIQSPQQDRSMGDWFANPEVITRTRDWPETLAYLAPRHGSTTRVAVIPNGTMAYYPSAPAWSD